MSAEVFKLYFNGYTHSLQFGYTVCRSLIHPIHEIKSLSSTKITTNL